MPTGLIAEGRDDDPDSGVDWVEARIASRTTRGGLEAGRITDVDVP
jgi:hypothetical protein